MKTKVANRVALRNRALRRRVANKLRYLARSRIEYLVSLLNWWDKQGRRDSRISAWNFLPFAADHYSEGATINYSFWKCIALLHQFSHYYLFHYMCERIYWNIKASKNIYIYIFHDDSFFHIPFMHYVNIFHLKYLSRKYIY